MTIRENIDAESYIRYDRTEVELEECLIWMIFSAGKSQKQMGPKAIDFLFKLLFESFVDGLQLNRSPFHAIRSMDQERLRRCLSYSKIGKYELLVKGLRQLANSGLNLRECTPSDLERIPGIGPKTSRFFLMGNREGVKYAILDVHILRFMREQLGLNVPKSTPPTGKAYEKVERMWLEHCESIGREDIAEYDNEIWQRYRRR